MYPFRALTVDAVALEQTGMEGQEGAWPMMMIFVGEDQRGVVLHNSSLWVSFSASMVTVKMLAGMYAK